MVVLTYTLLDPQPRYISEVMTLLSLELGKNVVVDGSLRDAGWYRYCVQFAPVIPYFIAFVLTPMFHAHSQYLRSLRGKFPKMKLAIVHVTASPETVLGRCRKRGSVTGRIVPEKVILDTMQQLPNSIKVPLSRRTHTLEQVPSKAPITITF